jgi:hypothetical protein
LAIRKRQATHVEAGAEVPRNAGSIPAASSSHPLFVALKDRKNRGFSGLFAVLLLSSIFSKNYAEFSLKRKPGSLKVKSD